jgi:hypothetical protein
VLAFGTQFPDLVDKPLNWWFDILDGRGIGHSVITTGIFCTVLFIIAQKYGRRNLARAFSVGVFTHLLGDSWGALLSGNFDRAAYLLWPVFPAPTYPKDSLFDHLQQLQVYFRLLSEVPPSSLLASRIGFQLSLFALVVAIWVFDGLPGVRTLWYIAREGYSRLLSFSF